MPTSSQEQFSHAVRALCDAGDPVQSLPLDELLRAIPRIDDIDFGRGDGTVIVRADLDVPIKDGRVTDATRLESCLQTIRFCLGRGLRVVLIGHLGRDPGASFQPVAEPLSKLLAHEVALVEHWYEPAEAGVSGDLLDHLSASGPGSVILLENVRRYPFERALWKPDQQEFGSLLPSLHRLASSIRDRVGDVEINDAIAASNRDFSSSVLPLAMRRTGMGFFIHDELAHHASRVVSADLLIFSGLKANKLDDLEPIIGRGHVRDLIVGGALAMSLVKANGAMNGEEISIGLAESDPGYVAYVAPERIDQAMRILSTCQSMGTKVHLPVDYILRDGSASRTIPSGSAQVDIGPKTADLFAKVILGAAAGTGAQQRILFLNGAMGMFEDPSFGAGTKAVLAAVAQATQSGLQTFVGGGDGRAALLQFGFSDQVTHAFTAGGTILKLMSGRAIPYLLSMYLQNTSAGRHC